MAVVTPRRSIGFVELDNPVGTVVGEDGASRHVYKTQIDGIGYALGFREQQYCGADAVRYIDGTSPVDGNESRRICDASQNPAFASAPTYKLQFWVVFYKIPTTSPMPDDNANSRGAKCRIADIAGGRKSSQRHQRGDTSTDSSRQLHRQAYQLFSGLSQHSCSHGEREPA